MKLHTSLSAEQARFALLIEEAAPYLLPFWDFDRREVRLKEIVSFLTIAAHGEKIMAQFFLMLWLHQNQYEFDLMEAASTLEDSERRIIAEWVKAPFWP